jgi:16S rRNA (adenine1518-N6/adenine1519-N6)-dimethyltransferase
MKHKPRKRFGQNFLQDPVYQQRIADSLSLADGAKCLEIGPGKGAITARLLKRFDQLTAIELDRDLVTLLEKKHANSGLTILQGDILKTDIREVAAGQRLSIIGNLPYNISSPLLFQLIENLDVIDEMVFMLQKEVVDRLVAVPGNKNYGRLSIMAQYYCQTEYLFYVSPASFNPPPKVDSAVLRITPWKELPYIARDPQRLSQIVVEAFSKRRKTLRNSLRKYISLEQIQSIGIDPQLRAEQLSVEDFVNLSNIDVEPLDVSP